MVELPEQYKWSSYSTLVGIKQDQITEGIDGYKVDIEAKALDGLPMINIIGMGDQAVKEAAERHEAAIDESGYAFTKKKVILSLAPGDRKKTVVYLLQ